MEVIKDSAPVDKRKLDPNKVGKVLLRGSSALSHKRNEKVPTANFMLKH